jgi:hypothetical protein
MAEGSGSIGGRQTGLDCSGGDACSESVQAIVTAHLCRQVGSDAEGSNVAVQGALMRAEYPRIRCTIGMPLMLSPFLSSSPHERPHLCRCRLREPMPLRDAPSSLMLVEVTPSEGCNVTEADPIGHLKQREQAQLCDSPRLTVRAMVDANAIVNHVVPADFHNRSSLPLIERRHDCSSVSCVENRLRFVTDARGYADLAAGSLDSLQNLRREPSHLEAPSER